MIIYTKSVLTYVYIYIYREREREREINENQRVRNYSTFNATSSFMRSKQSSGIYLVS